MKKPKRPPPTFPVSPITRMGTLLTKDGLDLQVRVLGECSPCGRLRYDVQAITGGPVKRVWASRVTLDRRLFVLASPDCLGYLVSVEAGLDGKPVVGVGEMAQALRFPEAGLAEAMGELGEGWKAVEAVL